MANHHLDIYHLFIAVLVIMRVRNQKKTSVSDGATRRPEDTTMATGEERGTAQNTPTGDDGAGSKPVIGSSVPDGPRKEKNSAPLRKLIEIATWNVRSMSDGKIEVVERERW